MDSGKEHIAAKAMQAFSERVKDAKFPSGGISTSAKDFPEYETAESSERVTARIELMHERNKEALEQVNNSLSRLIKNDIQI